MIFFGDWFKYITSAHLLLSLGYLIYFHQPKPPHWIKGLMVLILFGYSIEWVGIHTGWPFGAYQYLFALGPKLMGVPLIIGINWILLSYGSLQVAKIFHGKTHPTWFLCIKASMLMLVMDAMIEPLCAQLGFWKWSWGFAPIQNYLAWFVFGFVFCMAIHKNTDSKIQIQGIVLYSLQFVFFLSLFIHYILL
jgi:putative membrane protein